MSRFDRNNRLGRKFKRAGSGGHYRSAKSSSGKGLQKIISHNYNRYTTSLGLAQRPLSERVILVGMSLISVFIGLLIVISFFVSFTLPSVGKAERLLNAESTVFFDRDGKVLYTVYADENRENIPAEEIPDILRHATIAIEDDQFFKHKGFDVGGILKAVLSEFGIGSPRGGSTITQQFIKNGFLSSERTYTRKIKEMILSVRLEKRYTKDQILTMYLNKIPYGGTAYGVQRASEIFFDKDAKDLTLAEASVLAALPKAPSYYSPYGTHKFTVLNKEFSAEELADRKIENVGDLYETEYTYGLIGKVETLADGSTLYLPGRVDEVLKRMEDLKYISEEEKLAARNETHDLEFLPPKSSIKAPHFVFYVKEQLEKEYGTELVETGGLKVYTTIDGELQQFAEDAISTQTVANVTNYRANNMALTTMDAKTGEILAMVGSSNYFDPDIDGAVNIATSLRQPGSSFKPLVYAAAFLEGYGAGTVMFDVPTTIGPNKPNNYDGKFWGPMTVRRALAQSRNIPAAKSYFLAGQQEKIIDLASKMGISTLDYRIDYGWPLSLGTGEVKMLDMVEAFGTFANLGDHVESKSILRVEDAKGKVLVDNTDKVEVDEDVLDEQVAYIISDILSDVENGLGPRLTLPGRKVAAKTGTSNKEISENEILPSNLWTIGYTPQIVTAVWAGNSDGEAMGPTASGYGGAAPVWQQVMTEAHKDLAPEWVAQPKGVTSVQVSKLSGKLPGKYTSEGLIVSELFPSYGVPNETDDTLASLTVDDRNNKLPNEYCPEDHVKDLTFWNPQSVNPGFMNWDGEILEWYAGLKEIPKEESDELNLAIPDGITIGNWIEEESELCKQEFAEDAPSVDVSDYDEAKVPKGKVEIEPDYEAKSGVDRIEYFINDSFQFRSVEAPYTGHIRISPAFKKGRELTLKVKVFDENGYSGTDEVTLIVGDGNTYVEKREDEEEEEGDFGEIDVDISDTDLGDIDSESAIVID